MAYSVTNQLVPLLTTLNQLGRGASQSLQLVGYLKAFPFNVGPQELTKQAFVPGPVKFVVTFHRFSTLPINCIDPTITSAPSTRLASTFAGRHNVREHGTADLMGRLVTGTGRPWGCATGSSLPPTGWTRWAGPEAGNRDKRSGESPCGTSPSAALLRLRKAPDYVLVPR